MTMEIEYLNLLDNILSDGERVANRTGIDTLSLIGPQIQCSLREGFPLLTTKKMFTKGIFTELCWFIAGRTDVKYLHDRNVHIWDNWVKEDGTIGDGYGRQWRNFNGVDQLAKIVDRIQTHPGCRRLVVSAWNPGEIDNMALPPCHMLFQFFVRNGRLSCKLTQRSADMFLGVPFNIASYACLTHMVANHCGLDVGDLILSFGDAHIYVNHIEQVREQLTRRPFEPPRLVFNTGETDLFKIEPEQITIKDYQFHPALRGEVAV